MNNKMINCNTNPKDIFGINPGDECVIDASTHVSSVIFPFPSTVSNGRSSDYPVLETESFFDVKATPLGEGTVPTVMPLYDELQRMTCQMAKDFAKTGSEIYDIGCSAGAMLLQLHQQIDTRVTLVGIDHSTEILKKAQAKLKAAHLTCRWKLVRMDINHHLSITNASVVTMLALPSARPLYNSQIMERIYQGLNKSGCVIFTEKLMPKDPHINQMFINHSYDPRHANHFPENKKSKAVTPEAVTDVPPPYGFEEIQQFLKSTGFTVVEEFFRWYNFCGIIAVK